MDMTYFVILEIAVGVATIALALYRKFLSVHDESFVHLAPVKKSSFRGRSGWPEKSIGSTGGEKG